MIQYSIYYVLMKLENCSYAHSMTYAVRFINGINSIDTFWFILPCISDIAIVLEYTHYGMVLKKGGKLRVMQW